MKRKVNTRREASLSKVVATMGAGIVPAKQASVDLRNFNYSEEEMRPSIVS